MFEERVKNHGTGPKSSVVTTAASSSSGICISGDTVTYTQHIPLFPWLQSLPETNRKPTHKNYHNKNDDEGFLVT